MRIKPLFNLTGKVAIVTGASKGIGEAIARGMAEFGAQVVVSSRKKAAVDEVAKSFVSDGFDAIGVECHVAKSDDREALVNKTMERYGRIDILVNNAGTNPYFGPLVKMTASAYQKTMDINLGAALELSNLVHPHMKAQGGGSIIHISSIEGMHPSKYMSAYNISKAGLIMLGKNQAVEWGSDKIRVNTICPGFVQTKLSAALWEDEKMRHSIINATPLNRIADPDEMAGLAVFLASDASSFCTSASFLNDGGILSGGF